MCILAQTALLAIWFTVMLCCTSCAEALATAVTTFSSLLVTFLLTKLFLLARLESTF